MILHSYHWDMAIGVFRQRVTKKELQQILLGEEDKSVIKGKIHKFNVKHLGAGVYEVWFSPSLKEDEDFIEHEYKITL